MLPAKKRLNRTEFNRFFASGRRYHHTFFTLVHTAHPTFHGSVVVSKKIAARATSRNLLRRRTYEALYALTRDESRSGVYIIILKAGAVAAPYRGLKEALEDVLGRIDAAR